MRLSQWFMIACLISTTARAEPWLTPWSAGGLEWGETSQPVDGTRRSREFFLPDSNYISRSFADRPDDLELPSQKGERRFLRYVDGHLVSAWWLRSEPIPKALFESGGRVEFAGPMLGPGEPGWRAFGDGTSWAMAGRTALHWRDRNSDTEILVSRSVSTGTYGVRRVKVLGPDIASKIRPRITGELRKLVRNARNDISGCLERSPKPVNAVTELWFDPRGQPARIRVDTDQPAFDVTTCIAGAIVDIRGSPNSHGKFEVYRHR